MKLIERVVRTLADAPLNAARRTGDVLYTPQSSVWLTKEHIPLRIE